MRVKKITWLIEFGVIPLLILVAYWVRDSPDSAGISFWMVYLYLLLTVFHRLVRERMMFNKTKGKRKILRRQRIPSTQHWILGPHCIFVSDTVSLLFSISLRSKSIL